MLKIVVLIASLFYTIANQCTTQTGFSCFTSCAGYINGPSQCISNKCVCPAGYCFQSSSFLCYGCSHLTLDFGHFAPGDVRKGIYSVNPSYTVSQRPFFVQRNGSHYLYSCGNRWIVSNIYPSNNPQCISSMVSPTTLALVPTGTAITQWSITNEYGQWIPNGDRFKLFCSDVYSSDSS